MSKAMTNVSTIETMTEDELEATVGGLSAGNALTCDIAGGLFGLMAGIVGSGIGPVAGSVAAIMVGNSVKQLCINTIESGSSANNSQGRFLAEE